MTVTHFIEHEHDSPVGYSILQKELTMATNGLLGVVVGSMESPQVSRMMGQSRAPMLALDDELRPEQWVGSDGRAVQFGETQCLVRF
jgi:hypothetical protein